MAKTSNQDYSVRRGKLNKKDKVIYRISYGKQQVYTADPSATPPSPAQKAHRKFFGRITTLVNAIVNDPQQHEIWEAKRVAYNHSVALDPRAKRYKTVRSYAHFVLGEQLAQNEAQKRHQNPVQKALPKGLKMHIKPFSKLSTTELYEILKARFNVFYLEQHILYPDLDDIDYYATHFAIFRKGHVIAYARLFQDTTQGQWIIGRMLTVERGKGFGKYILSQIEQLALSQSVNSLFMHAQIHAVPFYEALGYTTEGEIFQEAGIPHIRMRKSLA